ncbi:putative quinol monooxygenase [Arthrobacter sp. NPDC056493]|uniref:putative quinol monooxygenase n=1 Tax=Arthrobacter sp. NPDC056493 TaxID=3345839 RepID=UPI00366DB7E5
MAHTIIATWTAMPGEGEHIADVLWELGPGIRAGPKNLMFHAQRSLDDPDTFVMYEKYTDATRPPN